MAVGWELQAGAGCSACPAPRVGDSGARQVPQDGCRGSRGMVLREQLSMPHCGAGKPLLSRPVNGQHGETESIFIKSTRHRRLGRQTEKGLWPTQEMG